CRCGTSNRAARRARAAPRRSVTASKPFFSESPARRRFEVLFKFMCLFFVRECNVGLDRPWGIFRRMWHFASIVLHDARSQVGRDTNVIAPEMLQALENVDVGHWNLLWLAEQ